MRITKEQQETLKKQANLEVELHRIIDKYDLTILETLQCLTALEARILKYALRQDEPST
jgi:hypothetical protein